MRLTHLLLGAVCLAATLAAVIPKDKRTPEDGEMKFISANYTEVEVDGEIRMECEFKNLMEGDIIIWKKGNDEPIFMDHDSAINDYRFDINNEPEENKEGARRSVMTLERINTHDDNTYYCGTMETGRFVSMKMRVKVHPTARMHPDHWPYTVLNLEPVTLRCAVTGNPLPKIHWAKEGGTIGSHVSMEGDTLRFPSVKKSDAGIYVCHANNSAGTAVAKSDLRVHDPHVITTGVSQPWVNAPVTYAPVEMNGKINISCEYDGNPSPSVEWYFNGAKLTMGRPTSLKMEGVKQFALRHANHSESILQIDYASPDYFGDYSCKVTNEHGNAKVAIYVTAMPSPPELFLEEKSTILTMTARAPNGIEEFQLFFRKPDESGWVNKKTIDVTKGDQTGDRTWSKQINLMDFLEAGQYEIQVQARNGYGYGNKAKQMVRADIPEKSDVPVASAPIAASSSVVAALLMLLAQ